MSAKRSAASELNRDNWDAEEEKEEAGTFRVASRDEIEKRVIRTAKRRTQTKNEIGTGVFSGFGGFNKTQPKSFDFLANLTNGNKPLNGSSEQKTEVSSTSAFGSPNNGGNKVSGDLTKIKFPASSKNSIFGSVSQSDSKSIFGVSSTTTSSTFSSTTVSSTSTPVKTMFGVTPVTSSTCSAFKVDAGKSNTKPLFSTVSSIKPEKSTVVHDNKSYENPAIHKSQIDKSSLNSGSLFIPPPGYSLFGITKTVNSSTLTSNIGSEENTNENAPSLPDKVKIIVSEHANQSSLTQTKNENDKKKDEYYSKLIGLNQSVSEWIKKHVEENPLCILTPIFRDYDQYLKEMKEEASGANLSFDSDSSMNTTSNENNSKISDLGKGTSETATLKPNSVFTGLSSNVTPVVSNAVTAEKSKVTQSTSSFLFGSSSIKTEDSKPALSSSSSSFSFGVTTPKVPDAQTNSLPSSSPFSFGAKPSENTSNTLFGSKSSNQSPFSFGSGKPFSFGSNIVQKTEDKKENNETKEDEEDAPPKVEYNPIVEENSVFDKKCKVFVKKDANFADKGIGTLYIKKIPDSGKHQLLVRANNNLGTVLLNLILSKSVPTQRTGKNNVMIVCIPTPDAKPPPVAVLIRVKTTEEADDLLKTLEKLKS